MNVLPATDGKPHSEKAIDYAMEYSRLYGAALFIMYVVRNARCTVIVVK